MDTTIDDDAIVFAECRRCFFKGRAFHVDHLCDKHKDMDDGVHLHDEDEECMNCADCGRCREDLDCQDRCMACGGHDCEKTHPGIDVLDDDEEA